MKELNARERYLRLFRGEPIDRIPVCPRVFENVVKEHFQTNDIEERYEELIFEYYKIFGFDIIDWNCTPRPHFELQEFSREGPGWKPRISEERQGNTTRRITDIETPEGKLRQVTAVTPISEWEKEEAIVEYPIKTAADFDLFEEFMPPPFTIDLSSIHTMKELIGDLGIVSPSIHGPFNILAYCYRRADDLFLDPLTDPDLFHRMMNFFQDRIIEYMRQTMEAKPDMIDIGTNVANSRAVSPEFLVEHILPYENRLAEFIQGYGIPALYHNCGFAANHLQIYDQLTHKMWGYLAPAPHGDVVLEEVLDTVPQSLILWGHIDQIDYLRKATPAEIEGRVKYICELMKPRGNYILGTTDYLEIDTPRENIRALVEAGHKYGRFDG